ATLLAVPEARVDLGRAFETVMRVPKAQPALGLRLPFLPPRTRPLTLAFVAAVAAAALVVVAFAAGGLFFQPTTVKTVPVTVADMQALSQLADYGTLTWTKEPQFQATTSAADASALAAGLQPPVVANLPQLIVAKSASPTAKSTQVTVQQLEAFILAQPGISKELKAAIGAIGDPSTTLLIPVPVEYATSKPVTVQGVDGVALGDNTGVGSGVVWVKDGYVYVVAGSIKRDDAVAIANNLN